jgi:hypothetical protein
MEEITADPIATLDLIEKVVGKGKRKSNTKQFETDVPKKKKAPQVEQYDWDTNYAALLEYLKEHGHCNVPFTYANQFYECYIPIMTTSVDGGVDSSTSVLHYVSNLGKWLHHQRHMHRMLAHKMPPEQLALLQKLVLEGLFFSLEFCCP